MADTTINVALSEYTWRAVVHNLRPAGMDVTAGDIERQLPPLLEKIRVVLIEDVFELVTTTAVAAQTYNLSVGVSAGKFRTMIFRRVPGSSIFRWDGL